MKKRWKGLLLFGTIIMTMFALTGCGKTKINLNDYVDVTFKGYNTVGIAEAKSYGMTDTVEATAYIMMMNALEDNLELFGMSIADMSYGWETSTPNAKAFMKNVTGSFDKTTGLSNGDTITFKWAVNEDKLKELEKELKVDFEYSDVEIPVEGLEEPQQWDPFEGVEISYDGLAPFASVGNIVHSADVPGLQYVSDKGSGWVSEQAEGTPNSQKGLSNGDIITVTIYAPDNQDVTQYCITQGKIPTALSKEFVVEGLRGYVTDVTDISTDLMNSMVSQGEDVFRSYVAQKWDKPENLVDISLLGNYFLTAKSGTYTETNNEIYLVYKVTAVNPDPATTVEFYYVVSWHDIMYLSDGNCSVDLSDYTTSESNRDARFKVGTYEYIGYDNLETLFNRCIVSKIDSYDYSSTIE